MAKAKTEAKSASAKALGTKTNGKTKENLLVDVAAEVEGLSQIKAFALVDELVESGGVSDFKLGGALAVIQSKSEEEGGEAWLEGHASFRELVEARFNVLYRKARYLIGTYKHLVEKQIPWEAVKDLGWTKLKELAPILTVKNVEGWAKKAEKMTVLQLHEAVAKALFKGGDAKDGGESTVTTMTFKLHKDQKEGIRAALDKAKKETATDVDTVALFNIAQGYLGNSVEISTTGGAAEEDKPKGKKALAAWHKERATAVCKSLVEDMDDEGAELLLGVFGEVWPKIEVNVSMP